MTSLPRKIFVGLVAFGSAAWLVIAWGVVPGIIEAAYNRESLDIFNRLLAAAGSRPLAEYLDKWQKITWGGLSLILLAASIPVFAWYWPQLTRWMKHTPAIPRLFRPGPVVTLFLAAIILLAALLYYLAPVAYVTFITEDYWMEYGTVAAYLIAAGILVFGMLKVKAMRRLVPLLLLAWALFTAGDEISWGQRIVGFSTPDFFANYNQQAEFNLHNFLTFSSLSYAVFGLGLMTWALPLSWGIRHKTMLRSWSEKLGLPPISPVLAPLFLVTGLFFLLPVLPKSDEIAEFLLSVSLAGLALDQLLLYQPADVKETAGANWIGFFAYLTVLTVIFVAFFPSPEGLRSRLNNFAAQVYPRNGLPNQAQVLFEYLESHPEMQTEMTSINYARFLAKGGDLEGAQAVLNKQLDLHGMELVELDLAPQSRQFLAELVGTLAEITFLKGDITLANVYLHQALTLDSEWQVPDDMRSLVP